MKTLKDPNQTQEHFVLLVYRVLNCYWCLLHFLGMSITKDLSKLSPIARAYPEGGGGGGGGPGGQGPTFY